MQVILKGELDDVAVINGVVLCFYIEVVGFLCSSGASENVYSMIQHPKDMVRPDSAVSGANGSMASPRPVQGASVRAMRTASPPCLIQRQVTEKYTNLGKGNGDCSVQNSHATPGGHSPAELRTFLISH